MAISDKTASQPHLHIPFLTAHPATHANFVLTSYLTQRVTSERSVVLLYFNSSFSHLYLALADHRISADLL